MIKQLLSISLVFSSLFAGICTSNVAKGYSFIENELSNHPHKVECEPCEEISDKEVNCCDNHLEKAKQIAIIKSTETKVSKDFIAKAFQEKSEMPIPKYEKAYENRLKENKAPPHLQFSLPRLE